jgi:peptidoglycan/LPS O-acetylase OafA/YrhL
LPYYLGFLGWAFLCGTAIRKFPDRLGSNKAFLVSVLFLGSSVFVPAGQVAGWMLLQLLAFAIVVIKIGSGHWGLLAKFADRWDASYGIYLLSFPIQQILIMQGLTSPYRLFFVSATVSIAGGLITWHFLERPMLEKGKELSRRYLASHPHTAQNLT